MVDFYKCILLCIQSAKLSKPFSLRNLCYSETSVVKFLGYRIAGISRKLRTYRSALRTNAAYFNS